MARSLTKRTRIWPLLEKKLLEENLDSSEVDPLARSSSLEGPSVPRGLPVGAVVQRPSFPPGALAVVPTPSTSPSVLVVSSNHE